MERIGAPQTILDAIAARSTKYAQKSWEHPIHLKPAFDLVVAARVVRRHLKKVVEAKQVKVKELGGMHWYMTP